MGLKWQSHFSLGFWKNFSGIIETHPNPTLESEGTKSAPILTFPHLGRKCAFTLAEVLITLGIIGVVAAITMPTLIQNYKKQVYVTQLKKSVSMLEQGFQKMLADEGVERLSDLSYWPKEWLQYNDYNSKKNVLSKGFKIPIVYNTKGSGYILSTEFGVYEDGYYPEMQFQDNSAILTSTIYPTPSEKTSEQCKTIKAKGGKMCSLIGGIVIDTNSLKGPNMYGRDIFSFQISDDGKLYPLGGLDDALYQYPTSALTANSAYWKTGQWYSCTGEGGQVCAARIIENGWKMDY